MPPRILIVEDEVIVQMDLRIQLEKMGYAVVAVAADAHEAARLSAEHTPDLVLMDINLGGSCDGIDAAAQIRRESGLPIVFLTAYVDETTLARAKQVGPYGYLVKPFDARALHSALQLALHRGGVDRQLHQSRDGLLLALASQGFGVILLDAEDRIEYVGGLTAEWLEVDPAAMTGRPWSDLLTVTTEEAALRSRLEQGGREELAIQLRTHRRHKLLAMHLTVEQIPGLQGGKMILLKAVSPRSPESRSVRSPLRAAEMIGSSPLMQQVFHVIEGVARSDSSVLIEGETGTGKELAARAIHQHSRRSGRPFVALNCAGLGEDLAASQLFGHKRGAFTGAVEDQQGLFEAAHEGTLFLDEIGELPLRVQTMLLRVLEEKMVTRIGETLPRPVDARIVAATNRSLALEAEEGRFRLDLLYRIRVGRVSLPPLRDRLDDLPELIADFLAEQRQRTEKEIVGLTAEALAACYAYRWPGNIRELRNCLEFAALRAQGAEITPGDLPPEIANALDAGLRDPAIDERARMLAALRQAKGNRSLAAELLGISRATFYRRLAQMGIDFEA